MSSFTSKAIGMGSRCINLSRSCIIALAGVAVLAAPSAWAHVDPANSNATGVAVTMTAFRFDGVTPVLPGTLTSCETVMYRATAAWAGGTNAAFEGGTWSITTPDGVSHVVTPAGGVPCIGGTFDDPDSANNGNRGLCSGAPISIDSLMVPYQVRSQDIFNGSVTARTDYIDAWSHISATDSFGVGGVTPFPLDVGTCDDALFCNAVEACDPVATDGTRLGLCVPGTPVQCADGFCFNEVCDEGLDQCVRSDDNNGLECNPGDTNLCIPDVCESSVCGANNGTPVVCDPETEVCTDLVCTEATGVCDPVPVNEGDVCGVDGNLCIPDLCDDAGVCVPNNGTPTDCDDRNVCTDDSCDSVTGLCVNVENQSCEPIPTLSVGGLVVMILTMLGLGGILIRRRLLRKATRV
jgi:hypothetical protein